MPRQNLAEVANRDTIPWDQRPHLRINVTSEVTGLSPSSIYRLASEGKLVLRRIAGRVVVETSGVVSLVKGAEPWSPSNRGGAARAKRAEAARSALRR